MTTEGMAPRRRDRIDAVVPLVVVGALTAAVLALGGAGLPLGVLMIPLALAFWVVVMAARSGRRG